MAVGLCCSFEQTKSHVLLVSANKQHAVDKHGFVIRNYPVFVFVNIIYRGLNLIKLSINCINYKISYVVFAAINYIVHIFA